MAPRMLFSYRFRMRAEFHSGSCLFPLPFCCCQAVRGNFILGIFPHKIYVYLLNRLNFTWCPSAVHTAETVGAQNTRAMQSDKHKIDFPFLGFMHETRKCTHEILMERLSVL